MTELMERVFVTLQVEPMLSTKGLCRRLEAPREQVIGALHDLEDWRLIRHERVWEPDWNNFSNRYEVRV